MDSTTFPTVLKRHSECIYFCIWYPFGILRSFQHDVITNQIYQKPYCSRQRIVKQLLHLSLSIKNEGETLTNHYGRPSEILSPPHLVADLFCASPCTVLLLLGVSWKMYFEFIEQKRLNQHMTTCLLCFCPFHTPEKKRLQINTFQPKMLNFLNTLPFGMWKEFCNCEYLLQECFFVPLQYKAKYHRMPLVSKKYVPHSNHIYQEQVLGLWFDQNHLPKLTKKITILFVSRKELDQNIYWCLRATRKYYKTLHSMKECPIPELCAMTAHKVVLNPHNKSYDFVKTKNLHHICYIQQYIYGPTLSQLIHEEAADISSSNETKSTKKRQLMKFFICFYALNSVHQLGLLAIRHNNLCPENFKVDFCLNPEGIKVHVKLINLHSASHLLTKTLHSRFLQSNPWFRSPELAYNIAIKTSQNKGQCSLKMMSRATDAWSTGLSLACFLLNKNIQLDCHNIQPLTFDTKKNAWKMTPNEWVAQMRNYLLKSSSPLSSTNDFSQKLALIIYDHLVKPEFYERNIHTVLERMTLMKEKITKETVKTTS